MCKVNSNGEKIQKYKFSWLDLLTDTATGETSASGFCGFIIIMIAVILFVTMVIWYFFHTGDATNIFSLMDKITTWVGIGSGLLGVRKISSVIGDRTVHIDGRNTTPGDVVEQVAQNMRGTPEDQSMPGTPV